jgi:branched-chain amino acid aminotransferase
MHARSEITLPEGIYDGVLLDADGNMLETLGANFYAVINGELRTAGAGVLPGIAQQIIFEIAPDIRKDAPHISELPHIQEAFITSSSRGIVPINRIDAHTLSKPGIKTLALIQAYNTWVASHLESL